MKKLTLYFDHLLLEMVSYTLSRCTTCTILLVTIVPFFMHMCLQKFVAPSSMGVRMLGCDYDACADFSPSDFSTSARLQPMLQRNGRQEHGTWFFTDADGVDSSGVW